ncbi:MAG: type I methionyl aminopeptidase [Patescibacteria group bacterium]
MIYKEKEIQILRKGGQRLSSVLRKVAKEIKPGISTKELDNLAEKLIREGGDEPAFLNYTPDGAKFPYPATLCVSINNEVVHGIPSDKRILKDGDIVGLDLGLKHAGFFTDMAMTVPVGGIDKEAKKLIEITEKSLIKGIAAAKSGGFVGDIGEAIENFVKPHGYGIVKILGGHGVGKKVHEDPYIPNYGKSGTGPKLVPGMVLALEPMLNEGRDKVFLDNDGYTFKTRDGKRSAHFEHTILITESKAEILTS